MDDEAGEEKSDKDGSAQVDVVLVVRRRLGEGEEEQEAADEQWRIVREGHRPRHEGEVRERHKNRDRALLLDHVALPVTVVVACPHRHLRELLAEKQAVEGGRCEDRDEGLFAIVHKHFRRGEPPFLRDHQHRRCGEIRHHTADGDVYEKQAEGGVGEGGGGPERIEFLRQQHRRDGHRTRLGDEGPEQRRDDQDRQPPGRRAFLAPAGEESQAGFGEAQDRPGRGERHDHYHEQRLGEIHAHHVTSHGR